MRTFALILSFAVSASLCGWASDAAVKLTKQQPYPTLDLNGFDRFTTALVDSADKGDSEAGNALASLLKASNAAARQDGSVRFANISPAEVLNTPPQLLQRVRQQLRDAQARLDWLNDNQKLGWNSYNQRKNVLFWLNASLDAKRIYSPATIEIDPNPMNQLPKGWENNIKKAKINDTPRAEWPGKW